MVTLQPMQQRMYTASLSSSGPIVMQDLIVWLTLQPMQRQVYEAFLNSDSVKAVFNQTSSALAALSVSRHVLRRRSFRQCNGEVA